MIEAKKIFNVRVLAIMIIMILISISLSGCSEIKIKKPVIEKKCEKTSLEKYREYLTVPKNRSMFDDVNIALILDTSGSMEGDKINRAKEASIKLIRDFDPRIKIALFEFNTNASMIEDFTKDKDALESSINMIKSGGSTFYTTVLDMAMESFKRQEEKDIQEIKTKDKDVDSDKINKIVIFLSDGQPKDNYKDILDKAKEMTQGKICIYTIQYTSKEEKLTEEMKELQKVLNQISSLSLSNTNCGKLYSDVSSSNLMDVFQDIYSQIKTIDYNTRVDIKSSERVFFVNKTINFPFDIQSMTKNNNSDIKFHFDIKSNYNYNRVPNPDECIDALEVNVSLFNSTGGKVQNKAKLVKRYLLVDSPNEPSYDVEISQLPPGKYSLILNAKSDRGDESAIKAYKRFEFEIVDDPEIFHCKEFSCSDFAYSIKKSIAVKKTVVLNDNNCLFPNASQSFAKTVNLELVNRGKNNRYIIFDKRSGDNPIKEYVRIDVNQSKNVFLDKGNYDIYCGGIINEMFSIQKTRGPLVLVIDKSMSMSGTRIEQAKYLASELIKGSSETTLILFNENTKTMISEGKPAETIQMVNNIELSGNSKIIPLMKELDSYTNYLSGRYPSETKTVRRVNATNSTANATVEASDVIKANIIIISDGMLYDSIKNSTRMLDKAEIDARAKNITSKGFAIHTISYGEDEILSRISNISRTIAKSGISKHIDSSYFESIAPRSPYKIHIDDYLSDAFNITTSIKEQNSSSTPFDRTSEIFLNIKIKEKMFDSAFDGNYFDTKCAGELEVKVEVFSGTKLVMEKKAIKVTKQDFYTIMDDLDNRFYTMRITVNLLDAEKKSCSNIIGKKEFDLNLEKKLIGVRD